jgi:hypothetical protein
MRPAIPAPEPTVIDVVAAQVAALRDRIEATTTLQADLLWQAADTLARQAALVAEFAGRAGGLPEDLSESCAAAAELGRTLDDLAFVQTQRADLVRQMAEGIVLALEHIRLHGPALSPDRIAAFYVSQDQHAVHAAVLGGKESP